MSGRNRPLATIPDRPVAHVWRLEKTDGTAETVAASDCQIMSGVLSFYTYFKTSNEYVVVRAFAAHEWHDVQLIETPPAPRVA